MMLEISENCLTDWRDVSQVLGSPIGETVEMYLKFLNHSSTESVMLVEDVLERRLFYSRRDADSVAERFQKFCAERDIDVVARSVPHGMRWKVETKFNGIDDE